MSDSASDDGTDRRSQILLTLVPTFAGIGAAIVSSILASGATDMVGVIVLGGFTLSSVGIGRLTTNRDFGAKDYLYMAFLASFSWFMLWAILLTAAA